MTTVGARPKKPTAILYTLLDKCLKTRGVVFNVLLYHARCREASTSRPGPDELNNIPVAALRIASTDADAWYLHSRTI